MDIDPTKAKTRDVYVNMVSTVAPRPIAFASTLDEDGQPNLAPFSFFNAFGPNPPTLVFSPVRRGSDGTLKDSFRNVNQVDEVVINVVTYDIVQQMNVTSTEYPTGVNEFEKSGLTPVAAEKVKPYRVKESPVQYECKVKEIIETGQEGGAGNLVICEVVYMHIDDKVFDEDGYVDPHKLRLVGRMGGFYYSKAFDDAVFKVVRPGKKLGIGVDQMPEPIRSSKVLTGNDLGRLATIQQLPENGGVEQFKKEDDQLNKILQQHNDNETKLQQALHQYAHKLLEQERIEDAWKVLLAQKITI